ncbi:MAG: energy transducer TonB [Bacteroidota bacterium]
MSNSRQIKKYTADDIIRYHSGSMSNLEMHELESAALEDSFLSDAIEGYDNKDKVDNDLAILREKINNRGSKKSSTNIRKLYTSLSIAASLLIIFSIAYFIKNKADHKQQQLSSNDINPTQNISPVLQETTPIEKLAPADSSSSFAKNDNNKNNNKSLEKKTDETSFDFSAKEAQELASVLKSEKPKKTWTIIEKTDIQPNDKGLALVSATQQQLPPTLGTDDTDAIAQADETKFHLNSKKETTANLNAGSYNLISADSINNYSIVKNDEVAAVTVSKAKAAIPAAANITNNGDMQMQEVVVSGYNNTRKKSLNTSVQKVKAKDLKNTERQTEADNTAFDNYVKTHKTSCLDNAGNEIHGMVTLKFNISKNGKPEKIKVEQSLDKACDDQAIKLLNEGPNWKVSQKKKAVVKITF